MNEGPLGPFSIWPLDVLCIRRLATLVNLLQLDGFTFRLGSSRSGTCVLGDRFKRDTRDPSVIVFSEIQRCQNPQFTQIVQKAKKDQRPPGCVLRKK